MINDIFLGPAHIEIQGNSVLELTQVNDKEVEFLIIGLSDPPIRIIDERPSVHNCITDIMKTLRVDDFAQTFNSPAKIALQITSNGEKKVILRQTRSRNPKHMLWIAIGLENSIPYQRYIDLQVEALDDSHFALFSLYKRPTHKLLSSELSN